ncbi:hypothetical protein GCM10009533_02410 [Saccharopolyspora spinosporotrichia]|uniref:Uncharacterized protein n=1 Tax=Saccharopolyspora erythraea TaxID=1836 RepID=A0ABN1BYS0_SACER
MSTTPYNGAKRPGRDDSHRGIPSGRLGERKVRNEQRTQPSSRTDREHPTPSKEAPSHALVELRYDLVTTRPTRVVLLGLFP